MVSSLIFLLIHSLKCFNFSAKELAIRCIELFVQNVAILRPISLKGRQRLQCDCNQLEVNLQLMVSDLSSLGKSYRTLRSLSQLIILPPEDLVKSAEENTIIAPYIWCLLLFGYGDNDLVSPHIAAGWSNEKLIVWLSDHTSERERLELISGAVSLQKRTFYLCSCKAIIFFIVASKVQDCH